MTSENSWPPLAEIVRLSQADPLVAASFIARSHDRVRESADSLAYTSIAARPVGPASPGPLSGVALTAKDVIDVKGMKAEAGSKSHAGRVPSADALCVRRLVSAGAGVVAKTTTPEFGLSWTTACSVSAETPHPEYRDRTAGGSSGGAAVSVARGAVPAALGTDDAGSVRLPAAFCGVVGWVGSLGRVPLRGIVGRSEHFTRVGVLARSPEDAVVVESIAAGQEVVRSHVLPERALWWSRPPESPGIDGDRADVVRKTWERCRPSIAGGAPLELFGASDESAFAVINEVERWHLHGRFLAASQLSSLVPRTRELFARGQQYSQQQYFDALEQRQRGLDRLRCAVGETTVLISPTVTCLPPPLGGRAEDRPAGITAFTLPGSMYGLPSITIPWGRHADFPLAIQVMGMPGQDALVLGYARALVANYATSGSGSGTVQ